jgi:hypothetical protein
MRADLESPRNPTAVWRYQPRVKNNDRSVTTRATIALCSGKFFGLSVNPKSIKMAEAWCERVAGADGRAGYTKLGERSSRMLGDHLRMFPVDLAGR